jgi:hypothetical protein
MGRKQEKGGGRHKREIIARQEEDYSLKTNLVKLYFKSDAR